MNDSHQDSLIFKQKLYENFKNNGLLSRLQTTLRANLLQKIQKPSHISAQKQQLQDQERKKPFHQRQKFMQSIISDYLQKKKMQYTRSIFMPQSQLDDQDCLNSYEIAEITNLNLNQPQNEQLSFIQQLVDQWVKLRSSEKRERSIQTDQSEPVSKKLQNIEKNYLAKIDYWKLIPNKQVSDNPTLYEHEQKLRAQFQREKQSMKIDSQRLIRQQIEKKYQDQYAFRLGQVTKQHQKRINELKMREKQVFNSLEKKKSELDQKAKQLSNQQLELISKYQNRQRQIKSYYKGKQNEIQKREKDFWKKELELKAKKREYEDTIRLVKQKAIGQTGEMPNKQNSSPNNTFYH